MFSSNSGIADKRFLPPYQFSEDGTSPNEYLVNIPDKIPTAQKEDSFAFLRLNCNKNSRLFLPIVRMSIFPLCVIFFCTSHVSSSPTRSYKFICFFAAFKIIILIGLFTTI